MYRAILLSLVAALLLSGCAKGPPPKALVRGKVTLDKKPLKEGEIYFVTMGKAPEKLLIVNGAYEGMVEVGERRVEVRAYKDAPKPPPMEGVTFEPGKMNYIIPRYNTDSVLKTTINAPGPNEYNVEVLSN